MTGRTALTVHQPYCGLIIAGFKPYETRPAPPAGDMRPPDIRPYPGCRVNRGDRIALHAAAAPPPRVMQRLGVGDWQIRRESTGRWSRWAMLRPAPPKPVREYVPLPLGAILGTAVVADAVPINAHPARPMQPNVYDLHGHLILRRTADQTWPEDIEDQRPYGIWRPGWWALLLEDIQATTDRCPACIDAGLEDGIVSCRLHRGQPMDEACFACWNGEPCPVCDGAGHCPPVPAKGREGFWRWSP